MKRLMPLAAATLSRGQRGQRPWANDGEVLEPVRKLPHPPAISLPEEYLRLRGIAEESEIGEQLEQLAAGELLHGATLVHELHDVLLCDGALFFAGSVERFRPRRRGLFPLGRIEHLPPAMICATYFTEKWFGHWIHEALPLELLAAQRGVLAVSTSRAPWLHEPGYRALLGLPGRLVELGWFETLLWPGDPINRHRAARLRELRTTLRAKHAGGGPPLVFLRRGGRGARRGLTNKPEVVAALEARGFVIVDPEQEDPAQLLQLLGDAQVVVCVEGSVHNHALLCAPEGCVRVTIQPPYRFNTASKLFADAVGHHWAYVVADAAGNEQDFTLPIERLLRTLDLAVDEAARRSPPGYD